MPIKQAGRLAALALTGLFVLCCKKDDPKPEPEPEPEPTERTEAQLIKDDIYKYYKLYSLWADESIPDYLKNPAEFTDRYKSAEAVLDALKKLTPVHGAYSGGVLDRFSFMEGINGYSTSNEASSRVKMDSYEGYGFEMFNVHYGTSDSKTVQPILDFVEGGSPAYNAGFRRSDIVTAINEDTNFSVGIDDESAKNDMMNRLSTALNSPKFTLQVVKKDGSILKRELTYTNYVINPIYKETVFHSTNNNVGYLALSSFEEIDETTSGKVNKANIDAVFKKFQDQQIKSLVVDLRYNGGGYVDAAIYVADLIGGSKLKSQLMLTYETNKYLQSDAAASLRRELNIHNTNFEGKSTLNLDKVYFLVSENTASAAEMLINVFRPHKIAVKIIASGSRTFGKPVGFFRQSVQNKIYFWPVSFMLRNKNGVSDYWDGLLADQPNITDYVFADLGDPDENMLEAALAEAMPASSARAAVSRKSSLRRSSRPTKVYPRPETGMIKTR